MGSSSVDQIGKTHELGAEVVRIMSGSQVGSPSYLKATNGMMLWASKVPARGVIPTWDKLKQCFDVLVTRVRMGLQLFQKDVLA